MAIVEKRCGNKQLLIASHIEKFMNLTTAKSVREVKKIYDSIEIHAGNLNSLKIDTSQYGPDLVYIVMSKLPDDIHLLITRTMPTNEEWDVNMLLENLKQEIDSREMCFRMSSGTSSITSNNSYESKNYRSEEEEFTGPTLYTGSRSANVSCTYCRREHTSAKCNVITDGRARNALLRNIGKCFGCLKSVT